MVAGAALWWTSRSVISQSQVTDSSHAFSNKSIAVLPFVNLSTDVNQGFFADGLSEDLLNLLTKIPGLQVTSRTSAFSYKGKEIKLTQVARELHVAHLLAGTVRRSGNRLRITAQLMDARTDTNLWAETYDRSLDDIFAVQDEIAAAVVNHLKVTLFGGLPKAKTADPNAYTLLLQARQTFHQGSSSSYEQAIQLYKRAITIDANLAEAWAGLANCYIQQVNDSLGLDEDSDRLAREAVNKALAIDPELAMAHAALGSIAAGFDNDPAAAVPHFERALALEPANTEIMSQASGVVRGLGRLDEALSIAKYIVAHDPLNAQGYLRLAGAYGRVGRFDEAIASLGKGLRLSPTSNQAHYALGLMLLRKGEAQAALAEFQQEAAESWRLDGLSIGYFALGQKARSDAALAELIAKWARGSSWNIAYVLAYRGEPDRAFEWLERAITNRDPGLPDTAVTWEFTKIHEDPRWLPFLRKIGRAPEQVATINFDIVLPDS
jgi:TolB-like protein/Tfp pilus assembly protein PilF